MIWTSYTAWALIGAGAILFIALISSLGFSGRSKYLSEAKELVRNAADWASTAEQDANPVAAVAHASAAGAYLDAALRLENKSSLRRGCGIDIEELRDTIRSVQAASAKTLAASCPTIAALALTDAAIFAASL